MQHETKSKKHSNNLWYIYPTLFLIFTIFLCTHTAQVLQYVPHISFGNNENTDIYDYLPPFPTDMTDSFKLGNLCMTNADTDEAELELINEASNLVNHKFETYEEFEEYCELLSEIQLNNDHVLLKIWKFVSFVNILWSGAILVMAFTFVPFMYYLFKPLWKYVGVFLKQLYRLSKPYLGQLAYLFSFFVLCQGYYKPASYGMYVSLSGLVCFMMTTAYMHKKNRSDSVVTDHLIISIVFGAVAMHYMSYLIGFLSIMFLYCAFGFSSSCDGLCYYIGFDNRNATDRCIAVSSVLIPVFFMHQKAYPEYKYLFEAFTYGIYVFCVVVYYLGLLICASVWNRSKNEGYYSRMNILLFVSLLAGLCAGNMLNIMCLNNIAIVFSIMFLWEKLIEITYDVIIVPIFLSAVGMYWASLWLHSNPLFLMSLFSPNV